MPTLPRKRKAPSRKPRQRQKVTKAEATGAVQRVFLRLLKRRRTGIVDDVYDWLDIPDSARMCVGAAIGGLARAGKIRRVAFEQTGREKAHGRHVTVWELVPE